MVGDTFGASVAADGSFRACVPAAMYGFRPPDGFAKRKVYIDIPFRRKFEYRTDLQQDTDRIPRDFDGLEPQSFDAFVAAFPASTRVLGLGESNHGSREFYEERTALVKELASKHGVRLLMFEAGYGEVLSIDDYVNGVSIDIERAVQDLGYWIYDTKTFLRTLAELRAFNAPLPIDKRIHIIGVDVQKATGAINQLRKHGLPRALLETKALERVAADADAGWKSLTDENRSALRATLRRIAERRTVGSVTSQVNRNALAAKSLLFRFDMWETTNETDLADVRDAAMARMVLEVLAVTPRSRATLWAHLQHIAREYSVDAGTMGGHLASELGDTYQAYALLALAGSARAWDMKQQVGVIAETLQAPPAHSLEAVLATRSGGVPITYWSFAHAKNDAARWLKGMHPLRTFGSAFMGTREMDYWNLQSFDGAILFQFVTPTDPTPTGERRAAK